jgi:endonuclease/exonuclease/phosphatase family metal-dependent hydrolase
MRFLERMMIMRMTLFMALATVVSASADETIRVVSYNCESGGAEPAVVAGRIAGLDGYDVWGFQEVQDEQAAALYETAAEQGENANFEVIMGTTGGRYGDYLAIAYDADRLELVASMELHDINALGRVRAPQVAHFRERASGREFLFVNNHLYRSKADQREWQAGKLNEWARGQTLPIIAVGDYNFDYHVENGPQDHDAGFDAFTADAVFKWVRPDTLMKTNSHPNYNTVLDFVFVGGPARDWDSNSTIIVEPADFPDNQETSDHRPVAASIFLGSAGAPGPPVSPAPAAMSASAAPEANEQPAPAPESQPKPAYEPEPTLKQQILERIVALEAELAALKRMVAEMPE